MAVSCPTVATCFAISSTNSEHGVISILATLGRGGLWSYESQSPALSGLAGINGFTCASASHCVVLAQVFTPTGPRTAP